MKGENGKMGKGEKTVPVVFMGLNSARVSSLCRYCATLILRTPPRF